MKNQNEKMQIKIFQGIENKDKNNFKLLNSKRIHKNKSNDLLEAKFFLKKYNNSLNNSKINKEIMKFSPLSQRNDQNKILLLEQKNINNSGLPIFLSSMANKNKFQIQSNLNPTNKTIIKSYSTKHFLEINKYGKLNNNNKQNDEKKINLKIINKENIRMNFGKINKTVDINSKENILKNVNINRNIKSQNINKEIILYNNIGSKNSFNSSSSENYTFIPSKKILFPKLSYENKNIENNYNNETLNGQKKTNVLDIEFLTKSIKNDKIKKLLKLSFKENKRNLNLINRHLSKLKKINSFSNILSDEEKFKNKNYKNLINSNIVSIPKRKEITNDYKDIKSLNTNRLIMSYACKNNKNNSVIDLKNPLIKKYNFFESKESLNKKSINIISSDYYNNKQKNNENNNNIKNKNKSKLYQKRILIIEDKKQTTNKKNKKKKTIKEKKFYNIFNIKKYEEIYSKNHFLRYIHTNLNEKTEKISHISNKSKRSLLIREIKEIKTFELNEKSNLKIYFPDISRDLIILKKRILKKEIKIKYNTYTNIKSKLFYYIFFYLYILPFKNFNLAKLFANYLFKSINFSTIYLPIVSKKKNTKQQGIIQNRNSFENHLSDSLYPEIKWKFMSKKDNKLMENVIGDSSIITKFINLDFEKPKNEFDIKDIKNKINKQIKMNRIVNLLNKTNKPNIQRRNSMKLDLSFMPQFYTHHTRNSIYGKLNAKRVNSWSNFNNKRKYFPHSVLSEKQFFDVPKRSFNVKINYAISNAILYNRVCDIKIDDVKKDKNFLIKNFADDDIHLKDLIYKKCIEKLKIAIHKSNIREGRKMLDDYYKIIKEIKGKKYIEETLRMLIIEREEELFCDYFNKNYTKIDINCRDLSGNTFLILSVKEGLKKNIQNLLEKKVQINLRNKNGNTALHFALGNKFFYIADMLKKYGADEAILNKKGLSPWECFGKIGDPEIFEINYL